jgi:hypothetical protein
MDKVTGKEPNENGKKQRHRSPNYPAVGLREAVDRVKKLYEVDGKAGAPPELVATHIGFASAHGEAMSVVAALKKFGLVEFVKDRLVPTQRAIEIINLQDSDARRVTALKDAALSPQIYRELVEQHKDSGFPANDVLGRELVTYKKFNPNAVAGFVKDFRDTLDFAGLSDLSQLKSSAEDTFEMADSASVSVQPAPQITKPPSVKGPSLMNSWTLSPQVTAELRISGEVSAEDLDLLRDYVEITIKALTRKGKHSGE